MIRYLIIVAVIIPAVGGLACDSSQSNSVDERTIQVGSRSLSADFLLTNEERKKGVVRRPWLREGEGVLFVYPEPVPNLHWANRTVLEQELSVAFVGPDRRIQRIEQMKPKRKAPVEAGQTVQFLLIVPGGWFRSNQIGTGDRVEVPDRVIQAASPVYSLPDRRTASIGDETIQVEIARTSSEREMGLMDRKVLPENQGMLFVYEEPEIRHFHMKNTLIPLDIAFIDRAGTIQEIKRMEPLDTTTVSSSQPATYVLEMRANWFQEHGIGKGQKIDLPFIRTDSGKKDGN